MGLAGVALHGVTACTTQGYGVEADGGCTRKQRRLRPCAIEAVTACDAPRCRARRNWALGRRQDQGWGEGWVGTKAGVVVKAVARLG